MPDETHETFSVPRPGADQTAHGAEFWGLWVLTVAIALAQVPVTVFIDNLSVVRQGRAAWRGAPPGRRMPAAWHAVAHRARQHLNSFLFWCPSHGKKPRWKPPEPYSAAEIRRLNHEADEQASAQLGFILDAAFATDQGRAAVARWTQRSLRRLHEGLMRQRQIAGLDPDGAEPSHPRENAASPAADTGAQSASQRGSGQEQTVAATPPPKADLHGRQEQLSEEELSPPPAASGPQAGSGGAGPQRPLPPPSASA